MSFSYETAFSRNIGWIRPEELQKLRSSRVAIAGLGGVGGIHLLTLARLGVGQFHLADFDHFELHNFNRQAGADISTIGRLKLDVMAEKALLINPEIKIKKFPQGVSGQNIHDFLENVDVFVDGFDVFVLDIRAKVFEACQQRGIPAVSAAPLGMGTSVITFAKNSMTFQNYFGLKNEDPVEDFFRFAIGMAPSLMHVKYLVDRTSANPKEKRAPSTPMGCELAAGAMGTQVLKLILNRGPLQLAPWTIHFDAFHGRLAKKYLWLGHRNPIFLLKVWIARKLLKS